MRLLRVGFAVALLVQMWALYVPRTPSVGSGLPLDKVGHLALFAVVTWFGLRLGYTWIVPLMVVQALASEFVQLRLLSARSGDWADVAADLLGIGLGWLLARRSRRPASSGSRR